MADDASFKALANETRRTVLRLVRDEAQAVGSLAETLGVSQPAVSQHLAVLRDAGLVTVEQIGRHRFYRADIASLGEIQRFFQEFWEDAAWRLAEVAERAAAARSAAS